MNGADIVIDIARDTLYLVISVSLPALLVSLIVGLVISIFQTVTSIQEQTLTFVPKILAVAGSWMLETLVNLWTKFSYYIELL